MCLLGLLEKDPRLVAGNRMVLRRSNFPFPPPLTETFLLENKDKDDNTMFAIVWSTLFFFPPESANRHNMNKVWGDDHGGNE